MQIRGLAQQVKENCCSPASLSRKIRSLLPIIDWARDYNVRECLLADVIAGLTIIVFHVPQSMGYSLIAQVPPVYGLYSAFFPALIYSLMGTSRQCAVGECELQDYDCAGAVRVPGFIDTVATAADFVYQLPGHRGLVLSKILINS